jgi:hypothetical protein
MILHRSIVAWASAAFNAPPPSGATSGDLRLDRRLGVGMSVVADYLAFVWTRACLAHHKVQSER